MSDTIFAALVGAAGAIIGALIGAAAQIFIEGQRHRKDIETRSTPQSPGPHDSFKHAELPRYMLPLVLLVIGLVVGVILGLVLDNDLIVGSQATPTPETAAGLYDDFNDPAYDGNFNADLWWDCLPEFCTQEDGLLVVRQKGQSGGIRLVAREYSNFTISRPMFFEAELMVDTDRHGGNVNWTLCTNEERGLCEWFSECHIDMDGTIGCWETDWPPTENFLYDTGWQAAAFGTWHRFRIEVDPSTMTFTYYIDDVMVGYHIPANSDKLREARFMVSVSTWTSSSADVVTGYVDNVLFGALEP